MQTAAVVPCERYLCMWMHHGGGEADDQIQLSRVCACVYVRMIKLVLDLARV